MKTFLTILSLAALAVPAWTAETKMEKKPQEKAATDKPAEEIKPDKKAREAKTADEMAPRALPMNARADSVDLKMKTFSMKRKDGVEVKHMISDKTEIKQGEMAAKFSDIKVGDMVSGLRYKKSETEYEVVKITKFGAPMKKEPKAAEKMVEEKSRNGLSQRRIFKPPPGENRAAVLHLAQRPRD